MHPPKAGMEVSWTIDKRKTKIGPLADLSFHVSKSPDTGHYHAILTNLGNIVRSVKHVDQGVRRGLVVFISHSGDVKKQKTFNLWWEARAYTSYIVIDKTWPRAKEKGTVSLKWKTNKMETHLHRRIRSFTLQHLSKWDETKNSNTPRPKGLRQKRPLEASSSFYMFVDQLD